MAENTFKVLILGGAVEGAQFATELAKARPDITIGIVVKQPRAAFTKQLKKAPKNAKITVIQQEGLFLQYYKGLLYLTLDTPDKARVFGHYMVIATGDKPVLGKFMGVPHVYTSIEDFPENAGFKNILVVGKSNATLTTALKLAKTIERVFVTTNAIEFEATEATTKRLMKAGNISLLPNCDISTVDHNGQTIQQIMLSCYASLPCEAVLLLEPKRVPDVPAISTQIIKQDLNGGILADEHLIVNQIPNIFAVGRCIIQENQDIQTIIDRIK